MMITTPGTNANSVRSVKPSTYLSKMWNDYEMKLKCPNEFMLFCPKKRITRFKWHNYRINL